MIYTTYRGLSLSRLGMGNMRLPLAEDGSIDRAAAREIIDYAFDHGVNYFDTAYMYHGGESERFLGEALADRDRDSYYLADKFPGFMMRPGQTAREIFEEQLERCNTEYFDFYLLHNVNEKTIGIYTDEDLGLVRYLEQEQAAGRIRHLGFSSHGSPATLERFVSTRAWDFAQIQLNYLDWTLRDAKRQYEVLAERGVPVWVMEPVRGGRLASLTPEADALLAEAQPGRSIASWAFRWLMRLEGVKVVLSGMTSMEQMRDNVATFEHDDPLTDEQDALLMRACEMLRERLNVPCTACGYCLDACPQGLDIPELINISNNLGVANDIMTRQRLDRVAAGRRPEDCVACGACADVCPQSIDIPGVLAKLAEAGSHG